MASKSQMLVALLGCGLASLTFSTSAAAQCQLCGPSQAAAAAKKPLQPITVTIETTMDFSKIGLVRANQGGTARIDPATGQRILVGNLISLAGIPVTGTVLVRGTPKEHVAVALPATIQMVNLAGATYPLTAFTTTLKNNPRLGDDGTLRFTFGALLQISGTATGTFRGSIPITVEYK